MSHVRRLGATALAVASVACGAARAPTGTVAAGRPFSLSSFRGPAGIQARLEGSIVVEDRWAYVTALGAVRTYQLDRQDYWDLRVRAGVARCQGRDVEIASEGRAVRLAPLLGLARDSARLDTTQRVLRDTLRLDVGVPPGTELARAWIALIFEWPFENVMATYAVHTNLPLDFSYGPWTGVAGDRLDDRCR